LGNSVELSTVITEKALMSEAMGIALPTDTLMAKLLSRAVLIFVTLRISKEVFILKEYKMNIKRGDIFYADLSPVVGSEQGGTRPVLVLQNNIGNRYSPTVIVCALTGRTEKSEIPTHVNVGNACGLAKESFALLEQIRTIDRARLREKVGNLSDHDMKKINQALSISVGLSPAFFL
jgi:mRNA interferase MazF